MKAKTLPALIRGPGRWPATALSTPPSRDHIAARGAAAVVPSDPCRSRPIPHDLHLHRERNRVERGFQKPKRFRRVATRDDKAATGFLAFATLAAIVAPLR